MKKSIVVSMAALTLLSTQASIGPQTITAAFRDDIKNTVELGDDAVKGAVDKDVEKFKDITEHWAESNINQALKKGYVSGYPDGSFLPNNNVTRAEFVKMTVSALDLKVGTASGSWYTPYVDSAQAAGIYQDGDFGDSDWNKPMTREEMSKVAVRALGISSVQDKQWMYLAATDGIISGTAPGEISPEGKTTRAQAITVIGRVLSAEEGKKLVVDKYAVAAAEMYWHKTNIFTVAKELFNGPQNMNNNVGINSWKLSNLTVEAPDGHVKGVVESITAIDWNDPNDPNRKLLPSKDKLVWIVGGKETQFTDDMKVYVVLLDSKLVVDKKPELYPIKRLSLNILGYIGTRDGIHQSTAIKSKDASKEIYGLVIPKEGFQTKGHFQILVETIPLGALGGQLYSSTLSTSVYITTQ
ncbi:MULTISPECIES: S-layer homology domain-containing protein [unclassified Paenibacillus]|uniref:S-layer homology domain-containing protein n=1 Tax=unclassified Paenibacillus TaxID=185978 RepID=UPI003634A57B